MKRGNTYENLQFSFDITAMTVSSTVEIIAYEEVVDTTCLTLLIGSHATTTSRLMKVQIYFIPNIKEESNYENACGNTKSRIKLTCHLDDAPYRKLAPLLLLFLISYKILSFKEDITQDNSGK